jgi:hypothetical protein
LKIIKRRERIESTTYRRFFQRVGCSPGTGLSFDCDSQGNVYEDELQQAARDNLRLALNRSDRYHDEGVQEFRHSYVEPAVGLCNHCGSEVELFGFTNTCECGTDYNMSGQELASRSQWGEETGEHLADILRIR